LGASAVALLGSNKYWTVSQRQRGTTGIPEQNLAVLHASFHWVVVKVWESELSTPTPSLLFNIPPATPLLSAL